jgi:hypothetical protein
MFCPTCKCEYLDGVTQCADCGVALVETLDLAETTPPEGDAIVSIWSGNDPRKFVAIIGALDHAEIPYTCPGATGYFIFPSMRPKMEIWVPVDDREMAEKVLRDSESMGEPDNWTPEEREHLALPESDYLENNDPTSVSPDLPGEWDDEENVSEVWTGDDEHLADTLIMCIAENGIPSHKIAEENHWRIVVHPGRESRAKEIIREVIEASPPQ